MFQVTDATGAIRAAYQYDIPADWPGSIYITTLGTITTGVWLGSIIDWDKISKVDALPSDIGAEAELGNPASDGYVLSSTTGGVRSWVAREPSLGNPGITGYILSSTTDGVRSWIAPGEPVLGNPASDGYVLSSTTGGVRSWVAREPALGNPAADGYALVSTAAGVRSWAGREPSLGNPAADGYVLSSTTGGVRSWIAAPNPTITNDVSTNATYYITWVTTTSGALPLYVSNTRLTINPSTGLLTASLLMGSSGATSGGTISLLKLAHGGAAANDNPRIEMYNGGAFSTYIVSVFPGSNRAELAFWTGNTGSAPTECARFFGNQKLGLRTTSEPPHNITINKPAAGGTTDDPQIGFSLNDTHEWVMGVIDSDSDKFKIGYNPTTPFRLANATILLTLTQAGGVEVAGTLNVSGVTTLDGGAVSYGANDSGGSGKRLVLVPNA